MRAYSGRNQQGQDGMCGNGGLAQTATERYALIFQDVPNDITSACTIHGSVNRAFDKLITSENISNYLNLDDTTTPRFTKTSFTQDGEQFDGMIHVKGTEQNGNTTIQTLSTVVNATTIKQEGRNNTPTEFSNTANSTPLSKQGKTIQIPTFETNDKISLFREQSGYSVSAYAVTGTATNPKIEREIICTVALCTLQGGSKSLHTSFEISGGGVTGDSLNKALYGNDQDKLNSAIQLRNN
jgi:hypothetical protein